MRQPVVTLSPLLGTPENARVAQQFRPLLDPNEGRVEATTSDFLPFLGGPRECRGYVAIPAYFLAPKKAEVRQPFLIFCPFLGTSENARVAQ